MRSALLFAVILIFLVSFVSAEVRINEVMAKTPTSIYGTNCEWIEISTSAPINITDWTLDTGSQATNISYYLEDFLIITKSKTSFLANWSINESKIIEWTGIGLVDTGDSISVYDNSSRVSNFSYSSGDELKSWQYCSGNWTESTPTPGAENNCTQPTETCAANSSCMGWGTCLANGTQTQTCLNTSTNCTEITYVEMQTCTYTSTSSTSAYAWLNWAEEEIINDEEFDIEVKGYNLLEGDYDIKVEIHFEENTTGISERYDESEDEWKSGNYYVNSFFSGAGNKTKDIKIRLKEKYIDFYGDAKMDVKLRKGDSIVYEREYSMTILKPTVTNPASTSNTLLISSSSASNTNNSENPEVIVLGSSKNISQSTTSKSNNSIIYKSKNEYIKQYAPYAFGLLCVGVIVMLLIDKKQKGKSWKE